MTSKSSLPARDDWNNFVGASPFGDVLQCLEWGELKKPQWQPVPLSLSESGEIKATALVLKRALPRTRRSIFYLPRGPILDWNDRETAQKFVAQIKKSARSHRAILIKIDPAVPANTPGLADTLRELGFSPAPDAGGNFGGTQPRFNMKLDISGSEDEVQNRFHAKWRYNIRLAARKGVVVRQSESRDDIAIFHEIYRVTAQRDGFTGRPLKYFEAMWDILVARGLAQFFVAEREGAPLSAAICFILGTQCWYVYGASSNEQRNVMPNHAMQWAMMQWARERGCTLYDFRGVHDIPKSESGGENTMQTLMESSDGLVRFKAGFGGQLVEYIGEWDLPLDRKWYWLWTTARPKLVAFLKKSKSRK